MVRHFTCESCNGQKRTFDDVNEISSSSSAAKVHGILTSDKT